MLLIEYAILRFFFLCASIATSHGHNFFHYRWDFYILSRLLTHSSISILKHLLCIHCMPMSQQQHLEVGVKNIKNETRFICERFMLQRNQSKKYARIHTFHEGHTFEFHCPLPIAYCLLVFFPLRFLRIHLLNIEFLRIRRINYKEQYFDFIDFD